MFDPRGLKRITCVLRVSTCGNEGLIAVVIPIIVIAVIIAIVVRAVVIAVAVIVAPVPVMRLRVAVFQSAMLALVLTV